MLEKRLDTSDGSAHATDCSTAELLSCPSGHDKLQSDSKSVRCLECGFQFPVVEGIPVMLKSAATGNASADVYSRSSMTETESVEFYNSLYRSKNDYKRYSYADQDFIRKIFSKLRISSDAVVADMGAGTGYFGKVIRDVKGLEPLNCDFSIEGFRTAREKFGLKKLLVTDAYSPALRKKSIDVMFAMSLTPFKKKKTEDVADLLAKLTTPLKSKGTLVFTWPSNLSGKIMPAKVNMTEHSKVVRSGYYNHTRKFLVDGFKQSGTFEKIESYVFVRPLSFLFGPFTFSTLNTWFTEMLMKIMPKRLSARILIVGTKK